MSQADLGVENREISERGCVPRCEAIFTREKSRYRSLEMYALEVPSSISIPLFQQRQIHILSKIPTKSADDLATGLFCDVIKLSWLSATD